MAVSGSISSAHLAADTGALTTRLVTEPEKTSTRRTSASRSQNERTQNSRIFRTANGRSSRQASSQAGSYLVPSHMAPDQVQLESGTQYEYEESIIKRRYVAKQVDEETIRTHQDVISVPSELVEVVREPPPPIDDLAQAMEQAEPAEPPQAPSQARHPISVQSKSYLESRFREYYENTEETLEPVKNLKIVL